MTNLWFRWWNILLISIHTPAKGVTEDLEQSAKTMQISIHTPAKGVTDGIYKLQRADIDFNPHSREGSDTSMHLITDKQRISIHTPAKGVTFRQAYDELKDYEFQSTLPRRE